MAQLALHTAEQRPQFNDYIAGTFMAAVLTLSAVLLLAQFAA
jgi:hypothetical protein